MKRCLVFLLCIMVSTHVLIPTVSAKAEDASKVDWWLVRDKNHTTPRVNDKLSYKYEDYDAYYVGDTSRKVIYLTFDEGYEKGYTPAILDTLKANQVPAIFFVTSPYVKSQPDLIKRMVNEGHIVANHSKTHPSMPQYVSDPSRFQLEFDDVANKYKEVTGSDMIKLFRPPMGHYSQKSLAMTKSLGYKTVFWSFAYKDFDVNAQPGRGEAKKIMTDNLHNGAIYLLHAISKTNTDVLDEFIKEAKTMGYTFELFQ
ncbi:MAG: delta-lactam-biosynthetic de-N-acetylase [Cellulosilyticaceae bacterium]